MTSLLNRFVTPTSRSLLSRTMSTQRAQLNLKNPSLLKSQAFVNNEWVSAKSGKTFKVTNPANNEVIGEVPEMGTEEEVEEVIAVAKKAFESWRNSAPKVSKTTCGLPLIDRPLNAMPHLIASTRPARQIPQVDVGQHRRPSQDYRQSEKPLLRSLIAPNTQLSLRNPASHRPRKTVNL